jgi:hypothetical protein
VWTGSQWWLAAGRCRRTSDPSSLNSWSVYRTSTPPSADSSEFVLFIFIYCVVCLTIWKEELVEKKIDGLSCGNDTDGKLEMDWVPHTPNLANSSETFFHHLRGPSTISKEELIKKKWDELHYGNNIDDMLEMAGTCCCLGIVQSYVNLATKLHTAVLFTGARPHVCRMQSTSPPRPALYVAHLKGNRLRGSPKKTCMKKKKQ